jgi:flotillin
MVWQRDQQLYIALLKRVQAANAETQSRQAQAHARAASTQAREARRAEVASRDLDNQREKVVAESSLAVAKEKQRSAVEVQRAARDAEAQVAGITAQIEAERERIEVLRAKFHAEVLVPAQGEKQRMILEAWADATEVLGKGQAELAQLRATMEIIEEGGQADLQAYLVENFERFSTPFARTLSLFPVDYASVITGSGQSNAPLSAIHPHPVEAEKARLMGTAFGAVGHIATGHWER